MNVVQLLGRLGADPETRDTRGGKVARMRLATSDRKKDSSSGEWVDATEWHTLVCFGRLAETAERFLTKGRQLCVEGKLRTSTYTGKDGVEKRSTEIIVNRLHLISDGNRSASAPNRAAAQPSRASSHDMSDIPF